MASCSDDSRRRIYKPGTATSGREPRSKEREEASSLLLNRIRNSYESARLWLAARGSSTLLVHLLDAGFCFGLFDPTSNIIANTLSAYLGRADAAEELSGVLQAEDSTIKDMEQRSLDGLVAFLTCFFPYLADWEAVRYLLLAGADLLAAACLIVQDRGLKRFDCTSATTSAAFRTALKCAALAAKHTKPNHLVDTWLSLSCRANEAAFLLADVQERNPSPRSIIDDFRVLLHNTTQSADSSLLTPWHLAASRFHPTKVPYRHSRSLKRVLLDTIHAFYLQALARLPAGALRSRYHRSMLKAGHCYGPMDPVSNIIINTVWYDAVFPPSRNLELDMISTRSLLRIEARSFYGLVSFLCTRYRHLNAHQAMRCLLEADANLLFADPNLDGAAAVGGEDPEIQLLRNPDLRHALSKVQQAPCTSAQEAFKAAATAAWHPSPDAQGELLSSCKPMLGHAALALLQDGAQLSSEDVRCLASLLSPKSPSPGKSLQQQSVPKRKLSSVMEDQIEEWMDEHTRISTKVKAMLAAYALQNRETMYELHVICGVNNAVSGPEYCAGSYKQPPFIYHHTHINFLASRKDDQCAGASMLFFAEISNDEDNEGGHVPLCCPVTCPLPCAERVRCLYCDHEGTKIVHPAMEKFHGRELEFEKMFGGEDPWGDQFYTNFEIIGNSALAADWVAGLEEDCIYCDYTSDGEDDSDDYIGIL